MKTVTFVTDTIWLCAHCDCDDERWFQDARSLGKDVRLWIQDELRWAVGDEAGA